MDRPRPALAPLTIRTTGALSHDYRLVMARRPQPGSHLGARRASGALLVALALLGAVVFGWGLPPGAVDSPAPRHLATHAGRVIRLIGDAPVAVAAPVVEAITTRGDARSAPERVRDLLGAAACAAVLLLVAARRRRIATAPTRVLRVAVVEHGGRAPPV